MILALNIGIQNILTNLAVSYEVLLTLVIGLGSLVFFAVDFKLGIISLLVSNSLLFIYLYSNNFIWIYPLVVLCMALVILAFTLFAVNRTSPTGGFT